jgi:hypothetical protein
MRLDPDNFAELIDVPERSLTWLPLVWVLLPGRRAKSIYIPETIQFQDRQSSKT